MKREIIIWALACLLFCICCSALYAEDAIQKARPEKNLTETLYHEDVKRTYHVHLPPDFRKDELAPLLIALHGGKGDGLGFNQNTTEGTLTDAAAARRVVLVFPEGINKQWCDG